GKEYSDDLEVFKHAKMEALRGKSLGQQTQSLHDQVQIAKQKVEGFQHELVDIATQISTLAAQYKTQSKELAGTKDELQQLEAQRAMAAHAAAQQASENIGISEMVQDLANTFDQLKRQHESAAADSASSKPAPPLPAPTQPPPFFSAPTPESLRGGMAKPAGPDSEEEDEATAFAGWGSGDKHALEEVADLMEQNDDEG
ncbi:unnamed protein product, partial [Prorocentrum cordatum]